MGEVLFLNKYSKRADVMSNVKTYNDIQQFAKIVLFFACNSESLLYKTKLNKLLFYVQFSYYKEHNQRLIAKRFLCDFYGPVMEDLDVYLSALEKNDFIHMQSTEYGIVVAPSAKLSESVYTDKEKNVLKLVFLKFDSFSSRQISTYSHNEPLWKNTALKDEIPLERASELNDIII